MKEKERALEKGKAVDGSFEEECQYVEPQRPLKRLRDQEVLLSPSSGNHNPPTNGVGVSVLVASIDCSTDQLSMTQPHFRTTAEFHDRLSSLTMKFDSTATAIEMRSSKLCLEEKKADEARKEMEKAQEAVRRKVKELDVREEAFEGLIKKEFSERRKLEELVEKLRKEIEAEKAEKESVEAKLKKLGERGVELEAFGGYLERKAIQVREGEKKLDERFQSKEKKFEDNLSEFRQKQAEFEKAQVTARRESMEFKAREEAFEVLMKKENSKRWKLEVLVEELKRDIEVEKEEKELVEAKLKELGERGLELEALRGCLETKEIQVREGEEELDKERKKIDERFQSKEKKFEDQLAEFRLKQAEFEKDQVAARQQSMELKAREEKAFEVLVLMKKEIAKRRKLEELIEELKNEIKVEKADKDLVQVKLREIGVKGVELGSLGGFLDRKAIQVREGEEELEKKGNEFDERIQLKEKKFAEQLAEFRKKQDEFEVRLIELHVKERKLDEKDLKLEMHLAELNKKEKGIDDMVKRCKEVECILEQSRLREAKFEEELAEFRQKQTEFQVRVVELNAKERETDEKVKQCREPEMNPRPCSYESMEKKHQEQFNMLSKRMDELELKRVKDLELIEKKAEMMSGETLVEDKRPAKSLDHSSEANIRHCGITTGEDILSIKGRRELLLHYGRLFP